MGTWKQFLILSVCLLGCASTGMAETTLIIATGELPPYVSERPEESFLTDLFQEVAKEMGVTVTFQFLPWKRCEAYVEDLKVWAAIPYVPTPEREKKFDFSKPLYLKETKFFYYSPDGKPKHIPYAELSDLKHYRIGGVRGYFYEPMFREAGIPLDFVNQEEQNFRKLQDERVDLVPALETLGWHMIKKLFPPEEVEKFFTLEKPLDVGANYLMMSKQYPDGQQLLAQFNAALKKIQESGVYQHIAEQHGLVLTY